MHYTRVVCCAQRTVAIVATTLASGVRPAYSDDVGTAGTAVLVRDIRATPVVRWMPLQPSRDPFPSAAAARGEQVGDDPRRRLVRLPVPTFAGVHPLAADDLLEHVKGLAEGAAEQIEVVIGHWRTPANSTFRQRQTMSRTSCRAELAWRPWRYWMSRTCTGSRWTSSCQWPMPSTTGSS